MGWRATRGEKRRSTGRRQNGWWSQYVSHGPATCSCLPQLERFGRKQSRVVAATRNLNDLITIVKLRARRTSSVPRVHVAIHVVIRVKGVELGHVDGRCSFDSIIVKYELKDPALDRLAQIVHGADVSADRDNCPEAAGLYAVLTASH